MRKLTLWTTVWITAGVVLTASVIAAGAQIQTRGAAGLHAQMQNATPIEKAQGRGPVGSSQPIPTNMPSMIYPRAPRNGSIWKFVDRLPRNSSTVYGFPSDAEPGTKRAFIPSVIALPVV
jgi:hypothetical protein